MTIDTSSYSEYMTSSEITALDYQVDAFNEELEAEGFSSKADLDQEDFLKLLITQLTTQDPTEPMDDKEFIGQMANFSSLNQMTELAESMSDFVTQFDFTKAVSLIGKSVSYQDDLGFYREGTVESVKVADGLTTITVDGMSVDLDNVTEVSQVVSETGISSEL